MLGHLQTRLLRLLQRFVPTVGTSLCSVPPFPALRAGVTDLSERGAFSSLGMVLGSQKEEGKAPDREPSWEEDTAQDFGEDSGGSCTSPLKNESVCLDTESKDTSEEQLEGNTDSEWSDDDDDDDDHDDSELNSKLWDSFLRNDDPYNPLNFCPAGRREENACLPDSQQTGLQGFPPVEDVRTCQDQQKGVKKVLFSNTVAVRPLVVWQFASRVARDGSCWLEMARDRERFRRRVQAASDIVGPCLLPQHRARVWRRIQQDLAARTTTSAAAKEHFSSFS
ncbi:protein phosphatase 1 regulatory subunit 15B-like isoform X1 [Arapaima gigas]